MTERSIQTPRGKAVRKAQLRRDRQMQTLNIHYEWRRVQIRREFDAAIVAAHGLPNE